jgi:hypothetical protein
MLACVHCLELVTASVRRPSASMLSVISAIMSNQRLIAAF